ncbi:HTH domain-containing protein [uncultured Pontibacter sp.]|uniref:COG2958 family protein n=1 Tax=uncultured Pontibacter sp. TaxID=453356 RepID=UPI002616C259|nr:HTH domain-containing protein [uncultured Pontibacter sp.]
MTFLELAEQVLNEQKSPLTANEIWKFATDKGLDKLLNSEGKTPWATLGAQIYVNARDNNKTPFGVVGARPKRFYLKKLKKAIDLKQYEDGSEDTENIQSKKKEYLEKDLHAFLTYYAFFFLRCYTTTINHSKSGKKEFGEWVHPDIVGCYFPIDEWKSNVLELSSAIGNISIRILSFELKRQLNFSNLRESFFQTVSNSSWANEGYLVAAEISKDEDFINELTRLSSAFGIGVIHLNLDDPNSTQIILPAKFKESLDWETINKLAMNKDFEDFLKRIRVDITSQEVRKEKYDKIFESEDLLKRIKRS